MMILPIIRYHNIIFYLFTTSHSHSFQRIMSLSMKMAVTNNMNRIRYLLSLITVSGIFALKDDGPSATAAFIGRPHQERPLAFLPEETRTPVPRFRRSRQPPYCISEATQISRLYMEHRASNHTDAIADVIIRPRKTASSTELSASFADVASMSYKVYCDLDGVLVDFEKGVHKLLKTPSSQLVKGTMWKHISRANAFYEHLDWTQDGKRLWEEIRHLRPDILTGVPYPKSSRLEKYNWCKRELGLEDVPHHVDMAAGYRDHQSVNGNNPKDDATNIITCWSNNKHMESDPSSVLIDDRECAREPWENAGGVFIHHVDAETTLQRLRERGIL